MKRLTDLHYREDSYYMVCSGTCDSYKCAGCNKLSDIVDKLGEYEDAEEQGLFVRLPCKVGDTVFRIWNGEIEQYQVVSVWFNDHIKRRFHAECFPFLRFYDEDIGKTVFFTREEAEAALAKEG